MHVPRRWFGAWAQDCATVHYSGQRFLEQTNKSAMSAFSNPLAPYEELHPIGRSLQPPYPRSSSAALALRWKAFGSLSACVEFAEDPKDPTSARRPFMVGNVLDPLAGESLMDPPVSSIYVELDSLAGAARVFVDTYIKHVDLQDPGTE